MPQSLQLSYSVESRLILGWRPHLLSSPDFVPFPICVFVSNSVLNPSYVGPVCRSSPMTPYSGPALAQL